MVKREYWLDYVKEFACILVVLGHFYQSMTKAGILFASNFYNWFNTTIYYFHVPLFFICSGYLYQKFSHVDSFSSWKKNVIKKLIVLGIPYLFFSTASWLLKTVFSTSVNSQPESIKTVLLLHPIDAYWYLYCLFFLFLLIPTFHSRKSTYIITLISLGLKVISCFYNIHNIYLLSILSNDSIWFVLGMHFVKWETDFRKKVSKKNGEAGIILFVILSIMIHSMDFEHPFMAFLLGTLACISVITVAIHAKESRILNGLAQYTMPIYLMHTPAAAALRTILIKIGITSNCLQIALGLLGSFLLPILAAEIILHIKYTRFILCPSELLRRRV